MTVGMPSCLRRSSAYLVILHVRLLSVRPFPTAPESPPPWPASSTTGPQAAKAGTAKANETAAAAQAETAALLKARLRPGFLLRTSRFSFIQAPPVSLRRFIWAEV